MKTTTKLSVRTYELDSFGHVNNATYLQYFEVARCDWLKHAGLPFPEIQRAGIQIVIADATVKFLTPAFFTDELSVTCWCDATTGASVSFSYMVDCESRGVCIATGTTKGVCIDGVSGKPRRWPASFREIFVPDTV
jgi:YbgC/YbaW family acyl-CoA thioester hydrolase